MVTVFGNNIVGGYANGVPLKAIYNNGTMVWNISGSYYIKWQPSNISSGTFSINGTTYNFRDYPGEFVFSTGIITRSAFVSNSYITSIDTNAYYIASNAFASCKSLSHLAAQNCEYIGNYAFNYGYLSAFAYMQNLYLPKCSYIGNGAFFGKVQGSISLPNCEYIGNNAFGNCHLNGTLTLPKCTYIGSMGFTNISANRVYLSVCEYIGSQAFHGYSESRSVYIYTSTMCSLEESLAFTWYDWLGDKKEHINTRIYVPASLVSVYKNDSIWSWYTSWINSI